MADDTNAIFKALFEQLGRDIGLDGMQPDEEGYLALQTEASTPVHCQVEDGKLMLLAPLGQLPAGEKQAPAMKKLLAANALWEGTGGATLAVEPTSDQVLLARRWTAAELEETGLHSPLETFLSVMQHWTGFLRGNGETPPAADGDIVDMQTLA